MTSTPGAVDPDNPVVRLCADGMRAEVEGRYADAAALFGRAWEQSADDYEACIAAHYVARHQPTDRDTLDWNRVALERADRVDDDRVRDFYPSLYLNLGWSHECVGETAAARRCYTSAARHLDALPAGPYTDMTRRGVEAALRRV